MKKKLMLIAGYLGGIAMATRFQKKKKTKKTKNTSWFENFLDTIVDIHKNAYEEAKEVVWTEENRAKLTAIKSDFQKDALGTINKMAKSGKTSAKKIQDEVQKMYDNRVELLEKAKDFSGDVLAEAKTELSDLYKNIKKDITKKIKKDDPKGSKKPTKRTTKSKK